MSGDLSLSNAISSLTSLLQSGSSNLQDVKNMPSQISAAGGDSDLQAEQDSMKKLQDTSAQMTQLQTDAQTQKMKTDTMNSISNGIADTGTKAISAIAQTSKSISY